MTPRNIVEMLRLEANAAEAECKPGTGVNGGVWHEHPELMRQAADEIERLQRYEAIAKDMLLCVVDAISGGGYEMDVEQLADIAVKHGMMEWVAYDPDEHGELPSCDPEPGDMIYWFDRSNMP